MTPNGQNGKKPNAIIDFLVNDFARYFLLVATVLVAIAFWINSPTFLSIQNLENILSASSLVGTLAIAVVIALASGEMNFAVGAQATLGAVVYGKILDMAGMPLVVAIIGGIVAGMLFGLIAITLTLKLGVPSFVATIGLDTFMNGVVKYLTGNKIYFSVKWPETIKFLGQGMIGPVPVIIIVFAIIVIGAWILVDHTKLGRHIFAVGTNKTACKQVGINTDKIKLIAFLISSGLASFCGILIASREYNIHPQLGATNSMAAFAAAMLGGTFLRPGRFNIQGTVVATLLMIVIQTGIFSTGTDYYARFYFQGVIFLIAVGFIAMTNKKGLPGVKFG